LRSAADPGVAVVTGDRSRTESGIIPAAVNFLTRGSASQSELVDDLEVAAANRERKSGAGQPYARSAARRAEKRAVGHSSRVFRRP
jgi:hypothetical protein